MGWMEGGVVRWVDGWIVEEGWSGDSGCLLMWLLGRLVGWLMTCQPRAAAGELEAGHADVMRVGCSFDD